MSKYMVGYNDNTISPLQLFLGARKMYCFTTNNEFLERYTAIWEKNKRFS